jgi:hypothetical protein
MELCIYVYSMMKKEKVVQKVVYTEVSVSHQKEGMKGKEEQVPARRCF